MFSTQYTLAQRFANIGSGNNDRTIYADIAARFADLSEQVDYLSVKARNAKGNGKSDDYNSIADAVVEAALSNRGIEFPSGVYYINKNLTIPDCKIHKGAILIPASPSVTISLGRITAGDYPIFDYSLGGKYKLLSGSIQTDVLNPRWTGTLGNNTDDTIAINNLINLAFGEPGATTRNGSNQQNNRVIRFPNGIFNFDYLDISGTSGLIFRGEGKLGTKLNVKSSSSIGIYGDMASYGRFENMIISCSVTRDDTHPLIDIDGLSQLGGPYLSANGFLFPQQWVFDNIYLSGNKLCAVGLAWCRLGGGQAQGDTVLFPNAIIGDFTFAGFMIGSTIRVAPNALDINIVGGDFQGHKKWAIYNQGGEVRAIGTGFQNQGDGPPFLDAGNNPVIGIGSATHVGNYNQIDNLGGDIYAHWAGGRSSITGCRTESYVLCRDTGIGSIIDSRVFGGWIGQWQPNTHYVQGQIQKPLGFEAYPPGPDGRSWAVFSVTPLGGSLSGGSEPLWATAKFGYVQENVTVTNTSAVIPIQTPLRVVNFPSANYWVAIITDPSGVNQKIYGKIIASSFGASITLDVPMTWSGSAIVRIGEAIVDNALTWMPYNYIAVEGDIKSIIGLELECGQINPQLASIQTITARVSRSDWLWEPTRSIYSGGGLQYEDANWDVRVGPGSAINGQYPLTRWSIIGDEFGLRNYKLTGRHMMSTPIFWDMGWFGTPMGAVGIGRCDGAYALPYTEDDKSRNVIGIIAGGIAPPPAGWPDFLPPNGPANTAGINLNINGGIATGNQISGYVSIRTAAGQGAGSQYNNTEDTFMVDSDRTVGNLPIKILDPRYGVPVRASAGVVDSGGVGFRLVRIPN